MTKKRKFKPAPKGSFGKGSSKISSGNWTSAEQIKNQFFAFASSQRAGKESGDAGYWTGGCCNWGGSHNLIEDCQTLANFANGIANIGDEKQNLTLAVNEQEFNNKKQQLVNKLQECISKCQASDSYSVASVCCIWNDFFGSFLKPWLDGLKMKFQADLSQLQGIEPKHQKEILQLESEIKEIEAKYKEAMTNAAKETDPAKKAKFISAAQNAEQELKKVKRQLSSNPLTKLIQYNHLLNYVGDLEKLFQGNVPKQPPTVPKFPSNPSDSGGFGGETNPTGGQTPWAPWGDGSGDNNSQSQSNQTQLLIFAGIAVIALFFLMNQKDHD